MTSVENAILRGVRRIAPIGAAVALCAVASVAVAALAKPTTVTTHRTSRGKALAAANGHALYLFTADRASKSNCYGACAKAWKPLVTRSRPVAATGSGANAKLLGTTRRTDHTLQVTYKGHPLYTFAKDKRPGQISGEGANQFHGHWYLVNTAGNPVKPKSHRGCPPGFTPSPTGCIPGSY